MPALVTDWAAIARLDDSGRRYRQRELYALVARGDRKAVRSWLLARAADRDRRPLPWRYERIPGDQVPADVVWSSEWPHERDREVRYGSRPGRRHRKSYGAEYQQTVCWSDAMCVTYQRVRAWLTLREQQENQRRSQATLAAVPPTR